MEYGICDFDRSTGTVLDKNGSLIWKTGTLEKAKREIEKTKGQKVALFFYEDLPGFTGRIYKSTREEFKNDPGRFGIAYYKSWNGFVFE